MCDMNPTSALASAVGPLPSGHRTPALLMPYSREATPDAQSGYRMRTPKNAIDVDLVKPSAIHSVVFLCYLLLGPVLPGVQSRECGDAIRYARAEYPLTLLLIVTGGAIHIKIMCQASTGPFLQCLG